MTTTNTASTEPTTPQAITRGRFVWYDLITTDVPAATEFYKKVAGWGTQDFDMGGGGKYQMWTVGDVPIGGVVQLTPEMGPPGTPPHWMSHVSVPDVDETVRQAESLGGKVLSPPTDIPTVGRYATIADPQGAAIAVYTSLQPTDSPFKPRIGEFSWHELMTTDHSAAFAFYSKLFDWEKLDEVDMGESVGKYLMFGPPGDRGADASKVVMYGGMFTMTPDMQMPPNWCYYIRVESADESAELVPSLGGQLLNGPMEVPGGDRIAQFLDPQGAMFAVHSVKKG
jgi:uncharacterized protein